MSNSINRASRGSSTRTSFAFGGLLLLAGRLGDLVSRRGVFLAGLGVFTLASLACGLAQSQEMLIGARFVQGIGGAMTSAVILGMIVTMFPEPAEQAKAIGVYGFVASAGGAVGLLLGGVLTQSTATTSSTSCRSPCCWASAQAWRSPRS